MTKKGWSPCKKSSRTSKRVPTLPSRLEGYCRVPPILLNTAEKHPQNKPKRLIGTVQVKASSIKGRDLIRAQPRARTVVPDGFAPSPRASSGSGRTLGSPEAKLGQTLSCSDLAQIASPTDRIACAFNAGIA
jgi:hypothetical protein